MPKDIAKAILKKDLCDVAFHLNRVVPDNIQQHRFDALVCLGYVASQGRVSTLDGQQFWDSELLQLIAEAHYQLAAAEFDKWVCTNGRINPKTRDRRLAEKQLFQFGHLEVPNATA